MKGLFELSRASAAAAKQPTISIRVDPRIELFSILFRLAGNPEYKQRRFDRYVRKIDAHFKRFRDHPAVRHAARLREEHAISFDAVMSLAIHVTAPPDLRERRLLAGSWLDTRWRAANPRAFLTSVRAFVRDAEFDRFLQAQRGVHALAEARFRGLMAKHLDLRWFDRFFGARPQARVRIAIGLSLGGMNFGLGFLALDGAEELHAIIGVSQVTKAGLPIFDVQATDMVVHELGHSFVKPIVDNYRQALRTSGRTIFPRVEEQMRRHAYTRWHTVATESILHAIVARYVQAHRGAHEVAAEIARQHADGFVWDDELFALLGVYEQSRDRYESLHAFFPHIIAYFKDVAQRIDAKMAPPRAVNARRRRTETRQRRG